VPDDDVETDARAAERLTFFSDAVVAIAMTLLAIDLPVPEGGTVTAFWDSVRHDDGHYLAFLVSFVVIAAAWSDHHRMFRFVRRTDNRLRLLNTCWLFAIVLNPFATKLLTTGVQTTATHALRFGFYALLQVLESGMLYAMLRHMITRELAPGIPDREASGMAGQSLGLMLGFGLSIPVFFATTYGWVLWFAVPLLVNRLLLRRRRSREAAVSRDDARPGPRTPPPA
jgi:TMEM175 potassium channel family protein